MPPLHGSVARAGVLVGCPLLGDLDSAVRALDGLPAVDVEPLVGLQVVVVRGGVQVVVAEEDLGVRRGIPQDLLRGFLRFHVVHVKPFCCRRHYCRRTTGWFAE